MEESILQEAERVILRREDQYGEAEDCFSLVAELWSVHLKSGGGEIDKHDVALMMCLLKIARATTGIRKRDNYVDIAGYAALAAKL